MWNVNDERLRARTLVVSAWIVGATSVAGIVAAPKGADAQTLGTFRWQLKPFCNVVSVAVTQVGGVYRLEGTDDQCGNGGDKASVIGTAFPNPDGTIGFGLNIVASPGGLPVHVDAALAAGGFDGTWKDSAGNNGAFVFTSGAGTGGNPRPLPVPAVPTAIQLRTDGGFVAIGTVPTGPIPASGSGTRMMWYPAKAAFRAGRVGDKEWDASNVGQFSVALGNSTTASGYESFAAGEGTIASGQASTAMGSYSSAVGQTSTAIGFRASATGGVSTALGSETTASGYLSTAMGNRTTASGPWSTAMGKLSVASGEGSTAMGEESTAQGVDSIAMGYRVAAIGRHSVVLGANADTSAAGIGSFVYGDASPPTVPGFQSFQPNQFLARAAGGVEFYTNAALTSGVRVAAGGSAWSSLSDVHSKENFRDLSSDDVLAKIAAMPVREWNYKAQDAAIRHVGPTAQDFHAAFGLGEDPLRISTIDADGIALAAVKALEARTRELQAAVSARTAELTASRDAQTALAARVDELEKALLRATGGGR